MSLDTGCHRGRDLAAALARERLVGRQRCALAAMRALPNYVGIGKGVHFWGDATPRSVVHSAPVAPCSDGRAADVLGTWTALLTADSHACRSRGRTGDRLELEPRPLATLGRKADRETDCTRDRTTKLTQYRLSPRLQRCSGNLGAPAKLAARRARSHPFVDRLHVPTHGCLRDAEPTGQHRPSAVNLHHPVLDHEPADS